MPIIRYSFYFVIPLLYFEFLSGFGNLIVSVDIRYFTDNEAGYIKIGFRKQNDPTPEPTSPPSSPPTRPATPSPPGTSSDPTRLQVPRPRHGRSVSILDDTSSYGTPVERRISTRGVYPGLAEESEGDLVETGSHRPTREFFDARETVSPTQEPVASTSTAISPQAAPIVVDRVRSPLDIQRNRTYPDPLFQRSPVARRA